LVLRRGKLLRQLLIDQVHLPTAIQNIAPFRTDTCNEWTAY
jgi:hypothetical protein